MKLWLVEDCIGHQDKEIILDDGSDGRSSGCERRIICVPAHYKNESESYEHDTKLLRSSYIERS